MTGLGPLRTRFQRSEGSGLSKFVGRQAEMDALRRAAEQAQAGHGQIVAAMAEPGVGKSRLFHEFKSTAASGWTVLEAFGVSHGKPSAYLPIIDLLCGYFNIAPQDDVRVRHEKLTGKLSALDRSLEDAMPHLATLLGSVEGADPLAQMDQQTRQRRTQEAIKRVLLRESLNQPLMIIFEDLHWIDGETQALLNLLADSIATSRSLLLLSYRPEYRHEWGNKTYYTQLQLDSLQPASATELLSTLLGERVELAPLKRLIIKRTEGNPFFMEEIVHSLFEQGVLVRNGAVQLAKSMNEAAVPATVQGILAARIDRLAPDEKELVQDLAVLGRVFPLGLVRKTVMRPDDELERTLSRLQTAEFIYEQPSFPDTEYTFKHALTQEVAYGSVLIERRKLIHERAAVALQELYANRLENYLGELAHHYRHSNDLDKAVEYLFRAGAQAVARGFAQDSVNYLAPALELLGGLPEATARAQRESAIQNALGLANARLKGWSAPEAERAYQRALELADQSADPSLRAQAAAGLLSVYVVGGREQKAIELGEQLIELAAKTDDQGLLLRALNLGGQARWLLGNFESGLEYMERLIAAYRPGITGWAPEYDCCIITAHRSRVLLALGFPARAMKSVRETLEFLPSVTGKVNEKIARIISIDAVVTLHLDLRDVKGVIDYVRQLRTLLEETPSPLYAAICDAKEGWALAKLGRLEEGLAQTRRAVAVSRGVHFLITDRILAEMCMEQKLADEGLAAIAASEEFLQSSDARSLSAEFLRLKGELLMLRNTLNDAEHLLREAIEVAKKQRAKLWELRATVSLARLLAKQGKRVEARAMLAAIYGWFSEGFDTADLKDAKALLDQLNA